MASFNAISLEQNALKRAKIERRRGPKPVRAALLWAQTSWLDGRVSLHNGQVQFQSDGRSWNFDGALLGSTKRALDKLSTRPLSRLERERLEARRLQWVLWHECASLENLTGADLRARFVLEALLVAPLHPSPAREVAALSPRQQTALLASLKDEDVPPETRELARWVARNGSFGFWRQNLDFPVSVAARLGLDGDAAPLLFGCGALSLSLEEIITLLEEQPPARVRKIAGFWMEASWVWPNPRPLCAPLKRAEAVTFGASWRELEEKWRSKWTTLWREIAVQNLEAAREALEFHEQLCAENLLRWNATITKPAMRARLFAWFEAHHTKAFELLETLAPHPDAAPLIALARELWLEGRTVQTEEFWGCVVVPSLDAARALGVEGARELRSLGYLRLAS